MDSKKHMSNYYKAMQDQLGTPTVKEVMDAVRKFDSGAMRQPTAGNGRYDLIPPLVLRRIALIFEEGAEKYGDRNYEKGIPVSNFINHALIHLINYLSGDDSEDQLGKVVWNIMAAMHMQDIHPELVDLPVKR
jgi:hypothetical protein